MKILFDSNQPYQIKAVNSTIDLLKGLGPNSSAPNWSLGASDDAFAVAGGVGNAVTLSNADLLSNLQAVQTGNGIPISADLEGREFSIEMETGTGKTYVYLRTVLELNKRYGLTKFVIVTPNIAIREGVSKTVEMTREHFIAMYSRPLYETRVFSSRKLSEVRQFSTSNLLQTLVINIDAFNKTTNLINQPNESLGNIRPIDLLAGCCPVVILDEPQSLDGDNAKVAIATLAPSLTLRYSATHRNPYNLTYRLTPIEAYELRLVKRIEVLSVVPDRDPNTPYVGLRGVKRTAKGVRYKLEIFVRHTESVLLKTVTLDGTGHDLFEISGRVSAYRELRIAAVDADQGKVELSNGTVVSLTKNDQSRDDLMQSQISETIREHLEKELAVIRYFSEGHRPKVLSLFFIDRVANYVLASGKIRRWFEDALEEFRRLPRYAELSLPEAKEVHRGYFSQTKSGKATDTAGDSASDEDTYSLIMRDKERLLSRSEPVRFIFSHSALREGWDNPNIFQICTLNETKSETKKRQEIGRGMRLPVDETGMRILDPAVNFLTVVANESYDSFARKLQEEIAEETGVDFTGLIANRRTRRRVSLVNGWEQNSSFRKLWAAISQRTDSTSSIDVHRLVVRATELLKNSPAIREPQMVAQRASVEISMSGVKGRLLVERSAALRRSIGGLPNPIAHLQSSTGLSRPTIFEILKRSGRLDDFLTDSERFLAHAGSAIKSALVEGLVAGSAYTPRQGDYLDASKFAASSVDAYEHRLVPVRKSIVSDIEVDSVPERQFVAALEARADIDFFVKLPRWFVVDTPAGEYWPDWGIVKEVNGAAHVYLVRETKSSWNIFELRGNEVAKLDCARRHFTAIGSDFAVVTQANQI